MPRDLATRLGCVKPRTVAVEILAELEELDRGQAVAIAPYLNDELVRAARERGLLVAAFEASAAIHECWKRHRTSLGDETGVLEVAPAPKLRYLAESGFRTTYENGVVLWSPVTGAHALWWGIADYHRRQGGTAGRLGFPVTDEQSAVQPPAVLQRFQDKQDYGHAVTEALGIRCGATAYWSPETGVHSTWGGIGEHYELLGGPSQRLGFPIEDEEAAGPSPQGTTGWRQQFQRGVILWSEETRGVAVLAAPEDAPASTPSIAAYYEKAGGVTGPLGFPVGPRHDAAMSPRATRGTLQRFQGRWRYGVEITDAWDGEIGGATVYRVWRHDAEPHAVSGAIGQCHERQGGTGGWLGFPLTDEIHVELGRQVWQLFEGGAVFWTGPRDTIVVRGEFAPAQVDDLIAVLGFPTHAEEPFGRGSVQFFELGVRTVLEGTARCWVGPNRDTR
ncbi:LGFP repeat-containing protein [Actinoplanes subglobosus]|uniref:LGFP repeat-containing protein n=1 Tax=Actinoplanes subglobosus TaxID=1547892 RepID=A0ABV8J5G6_9ACTN